MSHRRRGLLFAGASAAAALLAATVVARQESQALGEAALRPVLVAGRPIAEGRKIATADLEVRRFPASFLPLEALTSPPQAVGERAATTIPAGVYLTAASLERRPSAAAAQPAGPSRWTPVELAVAGAGALRRSRLTGGQVDVLVTRDSARGLGGRTRVEARSVRLIALEPGGPGASGTRATLAVSRGQAMRLIEADSYAREIRLITSRR